MSGGLSSPACRSWLFVPGSRPDRFVKAAGSGADAVIIDLEDAVAASDKAGARDRVLAHLAEGRGDAQSGAARIPWLALRINALDTIDGIADVSALLGSRASPNAIVIPKTESAAHLIILDRLLSAAGMAASLVALVETARGLASLGEIARATPRLDAIMLGAADLAADLGSEGAWEPLLYARAQIVAACAANALSALDAPYFDLLNAAGLEEEASRAKSLGFSGKAAIHPRQVAAINSVYTPSAEAIALARKIVSASARGAGIVDGRMVDEAMAREARRLLAQSAANSE